MARRKSRVSRTSRVQRRGKRARTSRVQKRSRTSRVQKRSRTSRVQKRSRSGRKSRVSRRGKRSRTLRGGGRDSDRISGILGAYTASAPLTTENCDEFIDNLADRMGNLGTPNKQRFKQAVADDAAMGSSVRKQMNMLLRYYIGKIGSGQLQERDRRITILNNVWEEIAGVRPFQEIEGIEL